jgi:hypothetical protein
MGCQSEPKKKVATRERQPDSNVKPSPNDIQTGMGTNEVFLILGKPFLVTPLKDQTEIWHWPSPLSRPFDNHFAILSKGKVAFVPKKPDSTPAEEMDAAWAFLNRESETVGIISQPDWELKTATVQVGDSPDAVKRKLGIGRWWDQYADIYGAVVAPNLEIFVAVFETNSLIRTKTVPYNDYFKFTKGERDQADQKVRADYVAAHPKMDPTIKDSILAKKLCVGMNPEQVELSWGKPEQKSVSGESSGLTQQWVYPDRTYVYFAEGKLLSWQKTE